MINVSSATLPRLLSVTSEDPGSDGFETQIGGLGGGDGWTPSASDPFMRRVVWIEQGYAPLLALVKSAYALVSNYRRR